MSTQRASDFLSTLSGRGLNLQRLSSEPSSRTRLQNAGASVDGLRRADLDHDGWIRGDAELREAFRYADGFDRNGDAGSLVARDAQGQLTAAGVVLDVVRGASEVTSPSNIPATREEAFQRFLAQSRREGSKGDHLSFLDRGLSSSPFKANAPRVAALFNKRPDGVTLTSGVAAGATVFPARGARVTDTGPLPFLGATTTQASVAVLTEENGAMKARWYGRDQDTNAPFWSAAKSANALGLIAKLNTVAPTLKVGELSIREAGQPGTAINLKALFQDITSYDAGVPRSNAGAGLLGRMLGNAGRDAFVRANTGHAVTLNGNFGGGTIFRRPEVVTADGRVVLSSPQNPGAPGRNRIAASDLTRLHAQAAFHTRLDPTQRLQGAQSHGLEAWVGAMAEDSARYADAALQALGLTTAAADVAISSKLGFGYNETTGRYEAAYSGVLQFSDTRQTPPKQRSMAFTLRGEHKDPVVLDASLAADMTELVRRLANDQL